MSVRVPKGVIVDGRSMGGRFVSHEQLISIAAAAEGRGRAAVERLATREYEKAARKHQRAADKYMDAPERWRERRQVAQALQQEWERVKDAAAEFERAAVRAAQKRPRRGPASTGKPSAPPKRLAKTGKGKDKVATSRRGAAGKPQAKRGASAREWEVGFKYRTTRAGRRGSDVDVNLRVRRVDGRAFTVATARRVLVHVRQNQETPDGYMIAGVDWKRPHAGSGWRHGDVGDMDNFWAPMFARDRDTGAWDVKARDVRYGAVKEGGDDGEG